MSRAWAHGVPNGAPLMLGLPPEFAGAPPGRAAPKFGADTPDPYWIENLVGDAALPQPGAGSETPMRQFSAGIDCERLSHKLSQLQAATPAFAGPGAPARAEPAALDGARLPRETYEQQAPSMTVSIGTVGHPFSCAAPCEHVGLPGGCPHGSMCKRCHLCGPSGASQARAVPGSDDGAAGRAWPRCPPEVETSVGSSGHPTCCAQPCKHRKRKGGCRNGADCPDCHMCHWRRQPLEAHRWPAPPQQPAQQPAAAPAAPPPAAWGADGYHFGRLADQASSSTEGRLATELPGSLFWTKPSCIATDTPSLGSIGHPLCCGPPCKYFHKKVGCKDGRSCVRCHLCQWHRYQARVPPGPPARCYQLGPRQLPGAPDCGPCAEGHTYSF